MDSRRVLEPANADEEYGVEDPRITRIGDTFYITYVAVSRHGVARPPWRPPAISGFDRHGIIFAGEQGRGVVPGNNRGPLLRVASAKRARQLSPSRKCGWRPLPICSTGAAMKFLGGSAEWDIGRIGAGTPPIRTEAGWLEFYHGNSKRAPKNRASAPIPAASCCSRFERPAANLWAWADNCLFPKQNYEREGFVPNVVFPTGIVAQGETC